MYFTDPPLFIGACVVSTGLAAIEEKPVEVDATGVDADVDTGLEEATGLEVEVDVGNGNVVFGVGLVIVPADLAADLATLRALSCASLAAIRLAPSCS